MGNVVKTFHYIIYSNFAIFVLCSLIPFICLFAYFKYNAKHRKSICLCSFHIHNLPSYFFICAIYRVFFLIISLIFLN